MSVRPRTWFITGASAGFGRALAEAALAQGDRVVATARAPATLDGLVAAGEGRVLALALDVTLPAQITAAVAEAERWGGIDILVNNAGYGFTGGIEESTDAEVRTQFEVNFFGLAALTRAVLPAMRARGSGFIVNFSSMAGVRGYPVAGYYCASKFAVEGLSESLAGELAPFGIGVMLVEPGAFRTDFAGRSLVAPANPNPEYPHLAELRAALVGYDQVQPGDPVRAADALIAALAAPEPPLRLVLGSDAYGVVHETLSQRLAEVEQWRAISESTDFPALEGAA